MLRQTDGIDKTVSVEITETRSNTSVNVDWRGRLKRPAGPHVLDVLPVHHQIEYAVSVHIDSTAGKESTDWNSSTWHKHRGATGSALIGSKIKLRSIRSRSGVDKVRFPVAVEVSKVCGVVMV